MHYQMIIKCFLNEHPLKRFAFTRNFKTSHFGKFHSLSGSMLTHKIHIAHRHAASLCTSSTSEEVKHKREIKHAVHVATCHGKVVGYCNF